METLGFLFVAGILLYFLHYVWCIEGKPDRSAEAEAKRSAEERVAARWERIDRNLP